MAVSEAIRAAACELEERVSSAMTVADVISAAAGEREPTWSAYHWSVINGIEEASAALLTALRAES